jgi:hypothetical protein
MEFLRRKVENLDNPNTSTTSKDKHKRFHFCFNSKSNQISTMLFRALAFATFLASSAAADNDSFLRGDRLLQKGKSNTLGACATLGNGFPKGNADFKLNLLGKMKDNDYKPQSGNNIAIALSEQCKGKNGDMCSTSANTKILLYNSDTNTLCTKDFEVVDPNGADGEAGLCLPDPFTDEDPCIDGEGTTCATEALYAIYGEYFPLNGFTAPTQHHLPFIFINIIHTTLFL